MRSEGRDVFLLVLLLVFLLVFLAAASFLGLKVWKNLYGAGWDANFYDPYDHIMRAKAVVGLATEQPGFGRDFRILPQEHVMEPLLPSLYLARAKTEALKHGQNLTPHSSLLSPLSSLLTPATAVYPMTVSKPESPNFPKVSTTTAMPAPDGALTLPKL